MSKTPATDWRAVERAGDQLHAAIATATREGRPTPCVSDPDEYTASLQSPDRAAVLVARCQACPVLEQCIRYAEVAPRQERQGAVLAGVRYDTRGRALELGRPTAEVAA